MRNVNVDSINKYEAGWLSSPIRLTLEKFIYLFVIWKKKNGLKVTEKVFQNANQSIVNSLTKKNLEENVFIDLCIN